MTDKPSPWDADAGQDVERRDTQPDATNNEWREFENKFNTTPKKLCQFADGKCSQCGHPMTASMRRTCEKAGGKPLPKRDARQLQPSRTFQTTNTIKPVATTKCDGELGTVCPRCQTHILVENQVCGRQTITTKKCCGG